VSDLHIQIIHCGSNFHSSIYSIAIPLVGQYYGFADPYLNEHAALDQATKDRNIALYESLVKKAAYIFLVSLSLIDN
jgi:hypothetical protein